MALPYGDKKGHKERLDCLLVERGLAKSREVARALILGGSVFVDDQKVDKAGAEIDRDAQIVMTEDPCPYVSRGGIKLAGALEAFNIDVAGKVAMDVGASTGGFTDCLLQRGAARVYAIDVGYGQLAWSLQQDPRVVVLDRQNIRYLKAEAIPEKVGFVTIDVSFISLEKVIPAVLPFLAERGEIVALVKPQFEVGKGAVGRGGIVRKPEQHQEVLDTICKGAEALGLMVVGSVPSSLTGKKGNQEFLVYLKKGAEG